LDRYRVLVITARGLFFLKTLTYLNILKCSAARYHISRRVTGWT
jgi:hypothetical protein